MARPTLKQAIERIGALDRKVARLRSELRDERDRKVIADYIESGVPLPEGLIKRATQLGFYD